MYDTVDIIFIVVHYLSFAAFLVYLAKHRLPNESIIIGTKVCVLVLELICITSGWGIISEDQLKTLLSNSDSAFISTIALFVGKNENIVPSRLFHFIILHTFMIFISVLSSEVLRMGLVCGFLTLWVYGLWIVGVYKQYQLEKYYFSLVVLKVPAIHAPFIILWIGFFFFIMVEGTREYPIEEYVYNLTFVFFALILHQIKHKSYIPTVMKAIMNTNSKISPKHTKEEIQVLKK